MDKDSGWIEPTINTVFNVYQNKAVNKVKYRKIGKRVEIYGIITPASEISDTSTYTNIFTLPAAYRPPHDGIVKLCQGTGMNRWMLRVDSYGVVSFSRYGTTAFVACPAGAWLPFFVSYFIN